MEKTAKFIFTDPLLQQIVAGLVVAAIVGIVGIVRGWWKHAALWVKEKVTRQQPRVPRETVRLVPSRNYSGCSWSNGTRVDNPIMHANAHLFATNITDRPIRVLRSFLVKPRVEASSVAVKSPLTNVFGDYAIAPHATSEISLTFVIEPPVRKTGEDLTAKVVVVDQYGNEHRSEVKFLGPEVSREIKKPTLDSLFSIKNPIEKEVVAVLNSEVARYAVCGRRVGGLGSVYIKYQGNDIRGVGHDSWTPDVPRNQSIVSDPERAELKSDNLEALMQFHDTLVACEDYESFTSALLRRLDRSSAYACVGYFIVLVLWRIGELPRALTQARQTLEGDKEYGYSNALMLLNGLLRYRHSEFTNEVLEEIERGIAGTKEHSFKIDEKIAAIRAKRLMSSR